MGNFNYQQWYQDNKAKLSLARKKKYAEDPHYKAAALKRSENQRKNVKPEPLNTGEYSLGFNTVAQEIGISVWTLREWRKKDYFPEPVKQNNRLWFSSSQLELLKALKKFFDQSGVRISKAFKESLQELVELTYANW